MKGGMNKKIYFTPEFLELMKKQTRMSPETLHKIMNPFCGTCLFEMGRRAVSNKFVSPSDGQEET